MAFSSDPYPSPHDERIDPEELTPVLSRVPLPGAEMPVDSPVTGRLGNGTTITSGLLLRPVRAHSSKPRAPAWALPFAIPPHSLGRAGGSPATQPASCPFAPWRRLGNSPRFHPVARPGLRARMSHYFQPTIQRQIGAPTSQTPGASASCQPPKTSPKSRKYPTGASSPKAVTPDAPSVQTHPEFKQLSQFGTKQL